MTPRFWLKNIALLVFTLAIYGCATNSTTADRSSTASGNKPAAQRCQPHMNGDGSVWKVSCREK